MTADKIAMGSAYNQIGTSRPTTPAPKKQTGQQIYDELNAENTDSETDVGIEESKYFLQKPNFFNIINEELGKRIVGEELSRKTVFLVACMNYVENITLTSSNLLVNSPSGSGKDFVVTETLGLFPKTKIVKKTRISKTALTYMPPPNKAESWDGYVLYLEDIEPQIMNSEVMKVRLSGESSSTITVDNDAKDIEIKGKPVIIITSASSIPHAENLRRLPIVQLDDSEAQNQRVMHRQTANAEHGISEKYNPDITKALSCLKRVKVIVPFATKLNSALNSKHLIVRTVMNRVIDLIKCSTALHQYQRETDDRGFLLATEQDYENARESYNYCVQNNFGLPLTTEQEDVLRVLKDCGLERTLIDVETDVQTIGGQYLRRILDKLVRMGFIVKGTVSSGHSGRREVTYKFIPCNTTKGLPEFSKLN